MINIDIISDLIDRLLGLLYPDQLYCICCGNIIDETRMYSLCDHCIRHIVWDTAPPGQIGDDAGESGSMKAMRCCQYGIYERTLIFSLKYNKKRYIARHIAEMMRDKLKSINRDRSYDIIVPVPLYKGKERKRGFNQTFLIGKYLGKYLGIECLPDVLIRVRETRPMRGLSPQERAENIAGCFAVNEELAEEITGKRVLLLDDFYTTGATAMECRSELNKAHPASVTLFAFAAK
ncbi:MAG: ComF family protein [Eubacterium sp.]|nr:ComF family protein [Eubacterium sp.]